MSEKDNPPAYRLPSPKKARAPPPPRPPPTYLNHYPVSLYNQINTQPPSDNVLHNRNLNAFSSSSNTSQYINYQNYQHRFTDQPRKNQQHNTTVGIENLTGQNNCFLNCVVQVLYTIEAFKERFLNSNQSSRVGSELQVLFRKIDNCSK